MWHTQLGDRVLEDKEAAFYLKLNSEDKRKIVFTSTQAWGSDLIFNKLHHS